MSGSHIVVVLTNTKGDVEGHRVCDKHIIRWRSHHPQWPWWTFQHAGYCPSSSWSRRTNPNIWENDTTLTAYLPPSGCRIVQRNRCPPNHPVVGWLAVSRIRESTLWQRCPATNSLNPGRCTIPRWWTISQLRRLLPCRMTLCIHKVRRIGESLQGQTAYVHAIMTPYDSCRRVLWRLLIKHTDEADMYHNSATPPLPACYGDTCEPHQPLNMLSRTAESMVPISMVPVWWSPYLRYHIDGSQTIQYRIVA
jgi:hypothetical protein